tara:strand:- start:115 stop:570 length:456 start_codon:yes stop_codon:yes gene_type:complete
MKKSKSARRVLTGSIVAGSYQGLENRIQLFDGRFTTGYRIVDFKIASEYPLNAGEWIAKLSTEPKSTISQWFWQDVQELAWAKYDQAVLFTGTEMSVIRQDNMVIEDLWISAYSTSEAGNLNYEITLEKYEFPSWTGAGVLVENLSQAGPQ